MVTYHCLQLHLYTYKCNYLFQESLTYLKSQGLILSKISYFFYFIFQYSNVLVISRFQWLISAEG